MSDYCGVVILIVILIVIESPFNDIVCQTIVGFNNLWAEVRMAEQGRKRLR